MFVPLSLLHFFSIRYGMIRVNPHYSKLAASYLFSTIAKKVKEYQDSHPEANIIRMGIGDVTLPPPSRLCQGVPRGSGRNGFGENLQRVRP
jgi:aspartate/methionine/tyrosine aminotransferase